MLGKRLLAFLVAIFVVMSLSIAAFADDLTDKENQLDNSQDKIDNLKDKIGDLKDQIIDGQNQVKALDSSITTVDGEIRGLQNQITDMQKKIDTATIELNLAIADYNQQDERMKSRINAMYKNGTTMGYMEVILESQSFSDFITRADLMQKIVNYDIDMLKEMKQKREEINDKKVGLEKDKAELVAMKNSLDSKKKSLVDQNTKKKNLVALLGRQKTDYESALKQEEAAAERLKREINALRSYKGNYDGSKWAILHKSDFPNGVTPRFSSLFGYRKDPITGTTAYHSGLDIATMGYKNIPVYAMAAGKVIIATYYGGYGNAVVIDHGSGLTTLYGHNNTLLVQTGQIVQGGQKIALSGSTGRSTGPHVHFGVQKNGDYIDPMPYFLLGN